ncbi:MULTISPECIES: tetratricopeptide repeat protein [Rhodomicrobium]|uniref:tetratricopeptide repeat protein n=1 Tax=Rhodomicrobium TaxID=1068 RepID=UPI000B4AE6FD|nr:MULTISPECIES: tetratricopeptide repeat protein [Rhodomicrobium]
MHPRILLAGLIVAMVQPSLAATDTALLRLQEGAAALMRGNFDQAITSYDQALKEPDLPSARLAGIYNDRGVANWRLGRHEPALADFNKSIELYNGSAATYNNRANVYNDMARYSEAIADLDRAIALAPAYGAAYNNRGNARFQLGRHEEALADYRRAIELMPTNAVPYNGRAQAQEMLGQPYAGLRFITRAISLNGKYTAAYRNRALILQHLQRDEDALADYERLITLAPEDPELYVGRGQVHLQQKKIQPAIKDFSKAIELDPQNAQAFAGRGAAHAELKRPDLAIADFDQAINLDPKLAEAYYRRADALFRSGNADRAEADLVTALGLKPNYAEVYKLRGEMAEAKADPQGAIAAYKQAAEFDPFLEGVAEPLKKLTGSDEKTAKPLGDIVKGWEIVSPSKGRFVALNPAYPQLKVLLEMHGPGQPEILDWTALSEGLRGFGLLRYAGGSLPASSSDAGRHELVAIVDLRKNMVVSIEPHIAGEAKAKWDWSPTGVVVTDAEGVISAHELRPAPKPKPVPVAQDRPWYEDSRGGGGGGGHRSRGLFDWLFR